MKRFILLSFLIPSLLPAMQPEESKNLPLAHSKVPSLKFLMAQKLCKQITQSELERIQLPREVKEYISCIRPYSYITLQNDKPHEILCRASANGQLDEQLLHDLYAINPNLDLNYSNLIAVNDSLSPLMYAACNCKVDTLELLLKNGARVDHECEGRTALIVAANSPYCKEIFALLCNYGANVNTINRCNQTPLVCLSSHKNADAIESAEILLQNGADINDRPGILAFSALMKAVEYNNIQFLNMLLKYKPNLELTNFQEKTAFSIAVDKGNKDAMQLLKDAGANINHCPRWDEPALIHTAKHDNLELVKCLLEWGANTEILDNHNETALIIATKMNNAEMVKLLLHYHANVNVTDSYGRALILQVLENRNFNLAQLLLEGMDALPIIDLDGRIHKLYDLMKSENIALLQQLLDKGLYKSLDNRFIGLLTYEATPAMKELLQNYRSPEYYQMSWHQRKLYDTQRYVSNHPKAATISAVTTTGIGIASTAYWLWKKKK